MESAQGVPSVNSAKSKGKRRLPKGSSHRPRDAAPPGVGEVGQRPRRLPCGRLDRQLVASHRSDALGGNPKKLGTFDNFDGIQRFARDDDAALRLTEQQGIEARLTRPSGTLS